MKKYEVIDHTADIGLRAYGKDLKKLFANAAAGMFGILADLKNVQARQRQGIEIEAPDIEELFLSWLSELLYQHNSRGIIFKEFSIEKLTERSLLAEARGEKIDLKRHRLKKEIKAVTYHGLKVEKVKKKGQARLRSDFVWQAEVIFDI